MKFIPPQPLPPPPEGVIVIIPFKSRVAAVIPNQGPGSPRAASEADTCQNLPVKSIEKWFLVERTQWFVGAGKVVTKGQLRSYKELCMYVCTYITAI